MSNAKERYRALGRVIQNTFHGPPHSIGYIEHLTPPVADAVHAWMLENDREHFAVEDARDVLGELYDRAASAEVAHALAVGAEALDFILRWAAPDKEEGEDG